MNRRNLKIGAVLGALVVALVTPVTGKELREKMAGLGKKVGKGKIFKRLRREDDLLHDEEDQP